MTRKIGILGGTFNPVHNGHLAIAEEVRDRLQLDWVFFIPSYMPPHKQEEEIPSALQRLEMIRLAISGKPFFETSDIEIERRGKSYTIDTILELRRLHPEVELYFIIGLDAFLEIQSWHRWQELLTLCRFAVIPRQSYHFLDLSRLDFLKKDRLVLSELDTGARSQAIIQDAACTVHLVDIPLYEVSSTEIRRRVRQGASIKYLLPEPVENYIIKNKIYA